MEKKSSAKDPLAGSDLEAVIGLEVHVQLSTRTKMFCGCETRFGAEPNTLTCPVCLGLPGALPYINRKAVEYAVRVGAALGSTIPRYTKFDRKNYFYPDLPKGYQISQFDAPICQGGQVEFYSGGEKRLVRLTRAHLEEDAGKNVHAGREPTSLVDLNRAGTPLLEIVSEPDIRSPEEAADYLRALRLIMLHLGVSDCNMEEGSLRCDCNVSLRPRGSEELETRAEIKNLNSFTFIENALRHEIGRQRKVRESGESVVQETRLYDPGADRTRSMRGKEEAHDYRYFPEPDLAPLILEAERVERLVADVPELPIARLERYQADFGLTESQAEVLVRDRALADWFEAALARHASAGTLANWISNAVLEEMNSRRVSIEEVGLSAERFADLVRAVDDGRVSKQKGKELFRALCDSSDSVDEAIARLGLEQISDESFLEEVVAKVIAEHPGPVDDVRAGKKNSVNFLVGQVMRHSKGQANPGRAAEILREKIGEGS